MSDMVTILCRAWDIHVASAPEPVPEPPVPICHGLNIILEHPALAKDHPVHQPCPILDNLIVVGVVLYDDGQGFVQVLKV